MQEIKKNVIKANAKYGLSVTSQKPECLVVSKVNELASKSRESRKYKNIITGVVSGENSLES